jgi:hypothetical protein
VVGVVKAVRRGEGDGAWSVVRAVRLERRIMCAGFVGMWDVSGELLDVLLRALHHQ